MSGTVDIPTELKNSLRKFRFARRSAGNAALIVKVNKSKLIMEEVEVFDSISVDDLAEELPENSPRFVLMSYELEHRDGRKSFPLILINWAPSTCEISMLTLHASAFLQFQNAADVSKIIEIRDGTESLTKDAIDAKLLT
ncbi:glia maturation factor beta [Dacryopinax primogenitus]|uniref:Glia maturation factor beta n=1 Tax=Dacryopinax primogenitus (strain DJM 731) TaxID=1858805 RepID=M5G4Z3_DACPD|nr:glia maturation factor beta [Dacryopinax primogenitus]EJU05336.1 glia maturation factor beta [Dacryopinax primogenitus]